MMTLAWILAFAAIIVAIVLYDVCRHYHGSAAYWRDAFDRVNAARMEDNNLRAVDHERWAELVEQARALARLSETPVEHIRNALAVLQLASAWETVDLVAFRRGDVKAIEGRLYKALGEPRS